MITSNEQFLDKMTLGDCKKHLPLLDDNSIDLLLSDIPYGINLDAWDVIGNYILGLTQAPNYAS